MDIDIVLPYVDMSKEMWQKLYNETCHKLKRHKSEASRYRQIIDLKYLLRCIDKFCPFVKTLYLIVQTRDQVPEYVKESDKLKIIEHKDIIPKNLLPTFNSATIDMHVHKIPNLAEHFILINDDIYPLSELKESDFFTDDGKPKINLALREGDITVYTRRLKNTELFIKKVLGIKDVSKDNEFYRDGHSWNPMIKSHWRRLYVLNNRIRKSCTQFREVKNLTQQLGTYYEYFSNNWAPRNIKIGYYDFNSKKSLYNILTGDYSIVCINDNGLNENVEATIKQLKDWFEEIVPNKSEKYEI